MSSLKRFFTLVCLLLLMGLSSSSYGAGAFQEQEQSETIRRILALTYPEGPTLGIKFGGTHRLPQASGEAKVERKRGTTEIELELDELKPATLFGGDYATYVLWAVSPEGHFIDFGQPRGVDPAWEPKQAQRHHLAGEVRDVRDGRAALSGRSAEPLRGLGEHAPYA